MKRTTLLRKTAIRRARKPVERRVGKLGIVRLTGPALTALRQACFVRDGGKCVNCGQRVRDDVPDWAPNKYHMAHIGNKRMYGDVIENVKTLCGDCHTGNHAEHNCGGKPLPRKPNAP
jgi:5-methylcytosine-specific restriction endonuclease McrA